MNRFRNVIWQYMKRQIAQAKISVSFESYENYKETFGVTVPILGFTEADDVSIREALMNETLNYLERMNHRDVLNGV